MWFRGAASAIVELLETHHAAPFPDGCRNRVVADIALAALDADVTRLASSYLGNGGLSDTQRLILEGCLTDAERLLPFVAGEARVYFVRVHDLAAAVLREAGEPPAA